MARRNLKLHLYNTLREISPKQFSRAKYFRFKLGRKFYPDTSFFEIPTDYKLSADKQFYIESVRGFIEEELDRRDYERRDDYIIRVYRKRFTVASTQTSMVVRHTMLEYFKEVEINLDSKDLQDLLVNKMVNDLKAVIDHAWRLKPGTRRFIVKLITPFYDEDGKLIKDEEMREDIEISRREGQQNTYLAQTDYSFGYSLERTISLNRKEKLYAQAFAKFDNLIENWIYDLLRPGGYLSFASKITLAGYLVEELM